MDDEKQKKKHSMQEIGSEISNIAKLVKYLKNPVILEAAVIILIIILLIGLVFFFESLPSTSLGWINNLLMGDAYNLIVSEEDLLELCNQLEKEYGYDLESYGFVEEIERRKGTADYNDETTEKAEKGEIVSVKSKYLEAYIVSERRTYMLANTEEEPYIYGGPGGPLLWLLHKDDPQKELDEEYNVTINKIAAEETIDEIWTNIWNSISEFGIEETEAKKQLKEYLIYKKNQGILPSTDEKLKDYLEQNYEYIDTIVTVKIADLKSRYSKVDLAGDGLIYLEEVENKEILKNWQRKSNMGTKSWRRYTKIYCFYR